VTTHENRRVRDKDGKRRALLDAATAVFTENGYQSAATKEIARRAGCSESLIFRYFDDKRGLFESVVSRQIDDAVTLAENRIAEAMPTDFVDYVRQLFLTRVLVHGQGEVPGWEIAGHALADPAFSMRLFLPNHRRRVAVIADGVRHYQTAGQVDPDLDPDLLAEMLANFTIVTVSLGPRFFGTAEAEVMRQIETGAKVFAAGVTPPSVTADPRNTDAGRFRRFRPR
jgi:AcrR family transcriptional regulator